MVMNPLKDQSIDKRSPIPMYYQIMRIFAHLVNTNSAFTITMSHN